MALQDESFGVLGKLHEGTCLLDESPSSDDAGMTMMADAAPLLHNYMSVHKLSSA